MTVFDLEKDDLLRLSPAQLEELIARLAEAEVASVGYGPGRVHRSGSIDAPDGGVDIRVVVPATELDTGFPARPDTIVQVKKSSMPPSAIKKEMRPGGTLSPAISRQALFRRLDNRHVLGLFFRLLHMRRTLPSAIFRKGRALALVAAIPEQAWMRDAIVAIILVLRGFRFGRLARPLKPTFRAFEIGFDQIGTNPFASETLGHLARDATAPKGVEHNVTRVSDHANEVFRQSGGETCRMSIDPLFFAIAHVAAVAFGVRDRDQVWRNRRAVVDGKLLADIVAGRAKLRLVAVVEQRFHAVTIGLQHASVARTRPRRFGKPPNRVGPIFHPNAPHIDPFGGCRQLRRIPPIELLGEVETVSLAKHDQKLEVIKAAHRKPRLPRAAQVDHKATVFLEDTVKLHREIPKPLKVGVFLLVAVVLFASERKRRARHDQVNGFLLPALHYVQAVGVIDAPQTGLVIDCKRLFFCHFCLP